MAILRKTAPTLVLFLAIFLSSVRAAYRGPTTDAGLNLIKRFEGFRANFYLDPVGIRTIGYGYACHVNPCNQLTPPLTIAQATTLLQGQLRSFENCVNQAVTYNNLNSAQFSALVSFSFNLGCGTLRRSTLLQKLNASDVRSAAAEILKFNKAGGRVLQGLVNRRAAEKALFCSSGGC